MNFPRSVHSVCLWDEKGAAKVHKALGDDILSFITGAQAVCFLFVISKL